MKSINKLTIHLFCIVYAISLIKSIESVPFPLEEYRHVIGTGKGCFYNQKYYNNNERINSTEPCLKCDCVNSKLKCFMKVCPLIKPSQDDGCQIEQNPNGIFKI